MVPEREREKIIYAEKAGRIWAQGKALSIPVQARAFRPPHLPH